MPYYSVHVHGENAESEAYRIREEFRGKRADYTGHPFFYVKNHSRKAEFEGKIKGMLADGHTATVKTISKAEYDR